MSPTAERIRDAAIEGGKAFVGAVNFVESLNKQYGKLKGLTKALEEIGVTVLRDLLGPFLDAYDVFVSTVGAIDRYEVGDHSAMFGHGMQAVGAGIGMGWGLVGAYSLIKTGTAVSMSGIGLAVGLLSVAIGLIGLAIVTWTSESWLELFFENCRFGELWTAKAKQSPSTEHEGFFERPDTEFFKWYDATRPHVTGAEESWETRPNVARQASEFLTAATGFGVTVTMPTSPGLSVPNKYLDGKSLTWDRTLRARHNDWTEVEVTFEIPDEFPDDSTIVLKRIDTRGDVYDVTPIWRTKLAERAPVIGLPKGTDGARYVVPETVVYHTSTGSNATTWNLHLAGKIIKPGPGQQMRGVGDTVDILFASDTVPAYLEMDVIPGSIETETMAQRDEVCRRSGEAVVYRDRVETVERV
ncbi:hypothetical protein [Halobellus marinus]|uniref:hypothetical protein n=1 Tax=Halobellus marinus TaxID=3075123 RepID=UPI0028A7FA5E|nr:hypothetical protein [Halobellus sp. DFY28]